VEIFCSPYQEIESYLKNLFPEDVISTPLDDIFGPYVHIYTKKPGFFFQISITKDGFAIRAFSSHIALSEKKAKKFNRDSSKIQWISDYNRPECIVKCSCGWDLKTLGEIILEIKQDIRRKFWFAYLVSKIKHR